MRAAYALLDLGATRQATADRLHSGAGELAISVGWLAHDSGRFDDARSHYAEALATARMTGDDALEAHAFCNTAFLARDAGRPREAVRAAQAAQRVARPLGSARLMSLLALREAGGWAGLADRAGCAQALARAQALFERGPSDADPEWMSFYGEAELEGLEAQCWSTLGDWPRAARHARHAARLQDPHFSRNIALYTAELSDDLARGGRPDEAAAAGMRVLDLLGQVQSSRIQTMLAGTARVLPPHPRAAGVSASLWPPAPPPPPAGTPRAGRTARNRPRPWAPGRAPPRVPPPSRPISLPRFRISRCSSVSGSLGTPLSLEEDVQRDSRRASALQQCHGVVQVDPQLARHHLCLEAPAPHRTGP